MTCMVTQGPPLRRVCAPRGPHVAKCSAVTSLKVSVGFEPGALRLHFALGPRYYTAGPVGQCRKQEAPSARDALLGRGSAFQWPFQGPAHWSCPFKQHKERPSGG